MKPPARRFIGCDTYRPYVEAARQRLQASNPFEDTPLFDKAGKALDMVQRTLFKELS